MHVEFAENASFPAPLPRFIPARAPRGQQWIVTLAGTGLPSAAACGRRPPPHGRPCARGTRPFRAHALPPSPRALRPPAPEPAPLRAPPARVAHRGPFPGCDSTNPAVVHACVRASSALTPFCAPSFVLPRRYIHIYTHHDPIYNTIYIKTV